MFSIDSLVSRTNKETYALHPINPPSFKWGKITLSAIAALVAVVIASTIVTNRIEPKGITSTIFYSLLMLIGAATAGAIKKTYETFSKEFNEFNSIKNDLQSHAGLLGDIGAFKAAAELAREADPSQQTLNEERKRKIAEDRIITSLKSEHSLTLIKGPHRSLKNTLVSRSLTELIKQNNQNDIPLWRPDSNSTIQEVKERKLQPKPDNTSQYSIIFLEHLDRFISDPYTFHQGLLRQWLNDKCKIIATIENPEFERYRTETNSEISNTTLSQGRDLINMFTLIDLNDILNEEISLSAADIKKLKDEIEYEWRQPSWLAALLRSAANWRYAGLGTATKEQLEALTISCTSLTDDGDSIDLAPDWDEIWKEATNTTGRVCPLFMRISNGEWQILDSVFEVVSDDRSDDELGFQKAPAAPSPGTLIKMSYISGLTSHQLVSIAWNMFIIGCYDEATSLFDKIVNRFPDDPLVLSEQACFRESYPYADNERTYIKTLFEKAYPSNRNNARFMREYARFLQRHATKPADLEFAKIISAESHQLNTNDWMDNLEYAHFLELNYFDDPKTNPYYIEELYAQALENAEDSLSYSTVTVYYAPFLSIKLSKTREASTLFEKTVKEVARDDDSVGLLRYPLALLRHADRHAEAQSAFSVLQQHFKYVASSFIHTWLGKLQNPEADDLDDIHAFLELDLSTDDKTFALTAGNFVLFSYSPKYRLDSGRALRKLLADGATTGDWSFEMILKLLRQEENPRLELLEAVAQALEDGDMARLDAFEEWRDL
jgi:hypothetical protein